MLPNKKYTPAKAVRLIWRRRWLVAIPFALSLCAVPWLGRLMPERYRSETLIMVLPQRVPDSYVKATVTERVEDRLPTISAQILSRSRLEQIIEAFNLYPEMRRDHPMEEVVKQMRRDIEGPTVEGASRESFRLSYSSRDPVIAYKVTARLASLYSEQNLRDRTYRADSTTQFLEKELEDAKARLIEHEKKLEAFRLRYAGQLPSQLPGNLQVIQSMGLQLQNLSQSMNRARERRLLLERQLADASALLAVSPGGDDGATPIETELRLARERLDQARRRYTPEHPALAPLEESVRRLEQRARAEASAGAAGGRAGRSAEEIERQRRIRAITAEIEVIDHQLAADQKEEERLRATIAAYEAKVDAVPTRESELIELNRGYDVLKENHDALLLKLENAKIAANLERGQIGEQFSVIDAASLPEKPYNRMRRLQIMAAAPVGGLLLGLLMIAVLAYLDTTFTSEQDVVGALQLPVLAVLPEVATPREQRRAWWRTTALDVMTVVLLAGSAAVLVLWQ